MAQLLLRRSYGSGIGVHGVGHMETVEDPMEQVITISAFIVILFAVDYIYSEFCTWRD
jgi:hypothetical protein